MSTQFDAASLHTDVVDGMVTFTPLATAKFLISSRGSVAHLPVFKSTLRSPAYQTIFNDMVKGYVAPCVSQRSSMWTELGKAIEGGADEDLVFAWLARVNWQLPRNVFDIDTHGAMLKTQCPYLSNGDHGAPLVAACLEGHVSVTTLLLKCGARPIEDCRVETWSGDHWGTGWYYTTAIAAAIFNGKVSLVKTLLRHVSPSLPDILHECVSTIHQEGGDDGKYYAWGRSALCGAISAGRPAILTLLLQSRADLAKPCYWVSKLIQTETRDLADGLAGARCHWTTAGTQPLQMAVALAEGGTSEIVKMLEAAIKSEQV